MNFLKSFNATLKTLFVVHCDLQANVQQKNGDKIEYPISYKLLCVFLSIIVKKEKKQN